MRKKLPSISSLLRKADSLFSKFIRNRDKECVLKYFDVDNQGRIKCRGVLQNGHLIKRGKHIHRFNEINCHALCSYHNSKDQFVDHDVYVSWFIKKYGADIYNKLVETKDNYFPFKRDYLEKIISKYKKYDNSL